MHRTALTLNQPILLSCEIVQNMLLLEAWWWGWGGTARGTHSTPPEVYLTCLQFILICFITGSTCQKAPSWISSDALGKAQDGHHHPRQRGYKHGGGGSAHAYEIHK